MGFTDPLRRAFGTPRQRPLSSVASYLVYADVRLHTPMMHHTNAGPGSAYSIFAGRDATRGLGRMVSVVWCSSERTREEWLVWCGVDRVVWRGCRGGLISSVESFFSFFFPVLLALWASVDALRCYTFRPYLFHN